MPQPNSNFVNAMAQEQFAGWVAERARQGCLEHYELLNGRVVAMPPAGWPHGEVEAELVTRLRQVTPRGQGKVFGSSQGFALPSGDTVEPDASFISIERWNAAPAPRAGQYLRVVPDLVIEILSPSTASRDRGEKRDIYEKNGVNEYWLVEPSIRRITILSLRQGRYQTLSTVQPPEMARSACLPDLVMDTGDLLDLE